MGDHGAAIAVSWSPLGFQHGQQSVTHQTLAGHPLVHHGARSLSVRPQAPRRGCAGRLAHPCLQSSSEDPGWAGLP